MATKRSWIRRSSTSPAAGVRPSASFAPGIRAIAPAARSAPPATARPGAVRAMRAYVEEVERSDRLAPWQDPEVLGRWQDGTAVDLVAG